MKAITLGVVLLALGMSGQSGQQENPKPPPKVEFIGPIEIGRTEPWHSLHRRSLCEQYDDPLQCVPPVVSLAYYCRSADCDQGPRSFGFNDDGSPYLSTQFWMDFYSEQEALSFLESHQGYGGMYLIEDSDEGDKFWVKKTLYFTMDESGAEHYTTELRDCEEKNCWRD